MIPIRFALDLKLAELEHEISWREDQETELLLEVDFNLNCFTGAGLHAPLNLLLVQDQNPAPFMPPLFGAFGTFFLTCASLLE